MEHFDNLSFGTFVTASPGKLKIFVSLYYCLRLLFLELVVK